MLRAVVSLADSACSCGESFLRIYATEGFAVALSCFTAEKSALSPSAMVGCVRMASLSTV